MPGVEAAKFIASGADVDVMLLDIRMPGKSGLDVLREAVPRPRYPIVAMTTHVDSEALSDFRYTSLLQSTLQCNSAR